MIEAVTTVHLVIDYSSPYFVECTPDRQMYAMKLTRFNEI